MSFGQWLLVSFISRNAGVGALGAFSFSLSTINTLIALLGLGFRWRIITEPDHGPKLTVLVMARAVLLGVVCPIVLVGLSLVFSDPTLLALAFPILAAKIAEALADICYGKAQRDNRYLRYGLSVFLRVGLGGAAFNLVFMETGSVPLAVLGIATVWFVVLVGFDLPRARDTCTTSGPTGVALLGAAVRFIGPAIRRGWPLSLSSGVGALALGIPNYVLMYFWGTEEVGYYVAFLSFVVILNLGAITFGQVALPGLTRIYRDGQPHTFLMALAVPVVLLTLGVGAVSFGFSLYGEPIVELLFGAQIATRAPLLATFVLFCAPGVLSQFMHYVLTSTASYHLVLAPSLASLAAALVVSLLLVPQGGLEGAMHTQFAMGTTHLVASLAMLAHLLGRRARHGAQSDSDAV